MKLPVDMQSFLWNGANKEILFNRREVALKEVKKKKKLEINLFVFQT